MPQETVKVMVRCRPMNSSETKGCCKSCVAIDQKTNQISITNLKDVNNVKTFTFDNVFAPDALQQTIYEESAFPLVENVVEGYNGTIFAYGQTGTLLARAVARSRSSALALARSRSSALALARCSALARALTPLPSPLAPRSTCIGSGKTFTMLGNPNDPVYKGIIPRTFEHIVNIVQAATDTKKLLVRCSYIEIYMEEIHDLLSEDVKQRMELKESPEKGIFIKDLCQVIVNSTKEMEKYMHIGNNNRATGETLMNKDSSRSHSIFTLYIESQMQDDLGKDKFTAGKLNLVDLAGSERQGKTQATGDRLKEANKINLSLSALGNVISALVDGKSTHIPYRDSKLTRMLQDSLGGNTKTIMIAAISPADYNYDESLSTLRYASRAKNIKNQPKINEDPKDALLREYAEEIRKLKELLASGGAQPGQPSSGLGVAAGFSGGLLNQEQLKQLMEKNSELSKYQEQMQEQIKLKEEQVQQERVEREKHEQIIKELQEKLMVGGKGSDEQQNRKYKDLKKKLGKQQKEREVLLRQQEQKQEEFAVLEKQYSSLQDEVSEMREAMQQIKSKYTQAKQEINDLEQEHEINREELLDTIRLQEKDLKWYQKIVTILLSNDELSLIRQNSEWNAETSDYQIPPFMLKEGKLKFPKLNAAQGTRRLRPLRTLSPNAAPHPFYTALGRRLGGHYTGRAPLRARALALLGKGR